MNQFLQLTGKQHFVYAEDLTDFLYNEFNVHTAVINDKSNDAFSRPQRVALNGWTAMVYAAASVANDFIVAVQDGVFPGYTVVDSVPDENGKSIKVWLNGGELL